VREVVKEVAHERVVAVTQDDLAFEMFFIVLEFLFDVRKLSVKLVFLRGFCGM
jgi:hypothetical protein